MHLSGRSIIFTWYWSYSYSAWQHHCVTSFKRRERKKPANPSIAHWQQPCEFMLLTLWWSAEWIQGKPWVGQPLPWFVAGTWSLFTHSISELISACWSPALWCHCAQTTGMPPPRGEGRRGIYCLRLKPLAFWFWIGPCCGWHWVSNLQLLQALCCGSITSLWVNVPALPLTCCSSLGLLLFNLFHPPFPLL